MNVCLINHTRTPKTN